MFKFILSNASFPIQFLSSLRKNPLGLPISLQCLEMCCIYNELMGTLHVSHVNNFTNILVKDMRIAVVENHSFYPHLFLWVP